MRPALGDRDRLIAKGSLPEVDHCNSDYLASDGVSWKGSCEQNDWEEEECGQSFVVEKLAWRRNG